MSQNTPFIESPFPSELFKLPAIPVAAQPDRLSSLPAGQIEKLYERLFDLDHQLTKEAIARGMGNVKQADILKMAGPFFDQVRQYNEALHRVISEMTQRRSWHGSLKPISAQR